MSARYFYGWNVVGATFVMALGSFGLGFYGIAVYVATLQQLHGWSASTVSAPITAYYVAGALLTAAIAGVYERFGPRVVVAGGAVCMAASIAALGGVGRPWQLYPVFLVMAVGWGSMSGAAINIILAPWWERRRGLAVSIAFNGATLGGVTVAPALIPLIAVLGFTRALVVAGLVSFAVVIAVAAVVMRRGPDALGLGPDGAAAPSAVTPPSVAAAQDSEVKVDKTVEEANASDYDALVLPGGVGNPDNLRQNENAVRFVRDFFEQGKPVGAICHAPWTLIEAGVVRGRTLTSFPSLQTDIRNAGGNWVDEEVHVDNGLVSSRKPDDLPAFNRKMIEEFAEGAHRR